MGVGIFLGLNAKTNTVAIPISSVFLTENITSFLWAKRSGTALEEEWRPSNKVWLCLPGANGRRIDHRLPRNPTHYCGSFTFYTSTRERTQRGRESNLVSRKQYFLLKSPICCCSQFASIKVLYFNNTQYLERKKGQKSNFSYLQIRIENFSIKFQPLSQFPRPV